MGEVYQARDTRLGRMVAVKVLPDALSADPDRLARFRREAETLAALNHPHIAQVYAFEEVAPEAGPSRAGGATPASRQALVLEFVDGEDLSMRMDRGPMAFDEALPLARQVAEALAAAHEAGIVHRDLKPANIKVKHDGTVKVLDFGLAKALGPADGASDGSQATMTSPAMTTAGTLLGTAAYMAPEQARGQAADRRVDAWAFGVVLFEMLTGRRLFDGANVTDVLASVVRDTPAFEQLPAETPPSIRRLLMRCLEKDPARRLDSMRVAQMEIADALADGGEATGATAGVPRRRPRWAAVAAALLVGVVTGVGLLAWLVPPTPERSQPASRLAVLVPNLGGASTALARQIGLTPDGQTLVYSGIAPDGENRTHRVDLAWAEPVVIPGIVPFLSNYVTSPDGSEFVGIEVGSARLHRYPLAGGTARPMPRDVMASPQLVWAGDGALWISADSDPERGIVRISPTGDVTRPFGPGHADETLNQILPGDRAALIIRVAIGASFGPAEVLDLTTGETTMLIDSDIVEVRYTAGYLVYVRPDGTMHAVPFDPERRAIEGEPAQIAEGVSIPGTGVAQFAVAANGTVAYVPEEPRSLVFVDREGRSRLATPERRNFHAPMFSPDGRMVSSDFQSQDGRDVWILDVDSGLLTRTTFDGDGHDATWMPDGRSLTYTTVSDGVLTLRRVSLGSTEPGAVLFASPQLAYSGLWLRDGSGLVTATNALAGNQGTDIARLSDAGRGPLEPLVATRFNEQYPAVSPDDRWLAFTSNQQGDNQVFVRPLGREGATVQVSLAGGIEPVWSPDGRELFYRSGAGGGTNLMAAAVATEPAFAITARRALFPVGDFATAIPHTNYGISPDGLTFVMVRYNPATRIMVIQSLPALVDTMTRSVR